MKIILALIVGFVVGYVAKDRPELDCSKHINECYGAALAVTAYLGVDDAALRTAISADIHKRAKASEPKSIWR